MSVEENSVFGIRYNIVSDPRETSFPLYCFPGCFQGGWVNGVAIEFSDFGWCGSFAYGDISPNGVSGVYRHPDKSKLLVVSKGHGFIVDPGAPQNTVEIKEQPIMGVVYCEDYGLVVIYDFVRFTAFGRNGKVWKTEALSYDGLTLKSVTKGIILGEAWSAPLDKWVEFSLDLKTGAYTGGAR